MTDDGAWLRTDAFAELAGVSRQAAGKALREGYKGVRWRGHALVVRQVVSRGGRAGLVYEVDSHSLPAPLGSADAEPPVGLPRPIARPGTDAQLTVSNRWQVISSILAHPQGSPERSAAVDEAAASSGSTRRTIYRWLGRYGVKGVRGLARVVPKTPRKSGVVVSKAFDQSFRDAGYPGAILTELGLEVIKILKGLWASRAANAGATEIKRLAEFLLLELCEARDVRLPKAAMRLSRRSIERYSSYSVINQRLNDRKAFDDAKPRIRRDWTGLAPMERVVGDVKHLDVIVTRADGTPAWPKIVAFMDAGTGRVIVYPLLLDPGEGVRQEHVIEAFLAVVSDPTWGFPQGLYLDNGSEFAALPKIDSALQQLNDPGVQTVIFARPYNASAKPIESLFARLDRYVFSLLPGYAGSNRLAKKTQTVGKPPKPYPGSWEEFCSTVQNLITAHNMRPVGGQWRNRSPLQWTQDKADAGWRPATVDLLALDAAFADHDSRRVDRGVVQIKGKRFTHPDLAALPARTVVDLALPWRRDASPLARLSDVWVSLQQDVLYPARWIEGARESGRRQRSQSQFVKAMASEAPLVDPVATKIRWSKRMAKELELLPGPVLDLGGELEDLGKGIGAAASEPQQTLSRAEARRTREMAITERLERQQRNER